ncbi:13464_t:CDS:1 [Ambispora gerdemannii]|uniref:13464_t:CDS:1 n=1 Tax=Ambispora gerdemannii TaxID=144530 RepID=A0A9N8ZIV8_9GLOM|nr:13464_t:CDS:1 [Ambispora gerdemannii]
MQSSKSKESSIGNGSLRSPIRQIQQHTVDPVAIRNIHSQNQPTKRSVANFNTRRQSSNTNTNEKSQYSRDKKRQPRNNRSSKVPKHQPNKNLAANVSVKKSANIHPLATFSTKQEHQHQAKNINQQEVAQPLLPIPPNKLYICMKKIGMIDRHFSDISLKVEHSTFKQNYHLNAINTVRSPFIHEALTNSSSDEIILFLDAANITPEGIRICFAHMIESSLHRINPSNVKNVFAAAYYLEMKDICAWSLEILKKDINHKTVISYIKFFEKHYKEYASSIEDLCYAFLIRKLPKVLQAFKFNTNNTNHLHEGQNVCKLQSGSGFCHNRGYQELLNIYAQLPFTWMKRILESKNLLVTSNMRYKVAKDLIAKRQELKTVTNSEFVYLTFGTQHYQNITLVEKSRDLQKGFRRVLFKVSNRK